MALIFPYKTLRAWATEKPERDEETNSPSYLITYTQSILFRSNKSMNQKAWESANTLLKQGLSGLGDRYLTNDIIDDSGLKLLVANDKENSGEVENAVKIRYSILDARLNLLFQKLEPNKSQSLP